MIKLQQFNVFSFSCERIKNNNFDLHIDFCCAEKNGEVISLADNEVLRAIRRIVGHKYSYSLLCELTDEKAKLIREHNSEFFRGQLDYVLRKIESLLFIQDFVSIEFGSTKEYNELNKNGFCINGKKFTWLMCGAGHQRTNRAMYVCADIYEKLDTVLVCGAKLKDMVLAKYNAYYALASSATYQVRTPRVCVVADCEVKRTKLVDFANEDSIIQCEKELDFNLFDGQGLISPQFSKLWAEDVGVFDYIPSAWGVRCAFIKGMCVTFDFHKFAKEVANNNFVTDIWGNVVNIENVDVVLTQSQFKLWNCYDSWNEYADNASMQGFSWGISKVSPRVEDEKIKMFTNYQFLQILNLSDSDIEGLCKPTIEWVKNVACGDIDFTELYLLGKIANSKDTDKIWGKVQDEFLKCLIIENKLINDSYCKNRIIKSINKKINESYFGNLMVDGNFMARISDPYALSEHIFGMEIKGLIGDNEHYSSFWNDRNVKTVVAMRSPLTYKTEAHKLNLQDNENTSKWYQYLTSGVVYNVFGVDCLLEAGADYDFDIVATTNNNYFINGILGNNIAVVYEAHKPPKEKIEKKKLAKIAGVGFNTQIGYLTNLSTTLYEMQSQYAVGSVEWGELEERLKFCCKLQSMQIDKAKGLDIDEIPKHWTEFRYAIKLDGGEKGLNCKLLIEDRPYFMRYRYSKYNKEYKNVVRDFNRYVSMAYGEDKTLEHKESQEYADLVKFYKKRNGLLETSGTMNRICMYMEKELAGVKNTRFGEYAEEAYEVLFDTNIQMSEGNIQKMLDIRTEYLDFKKNTKLSDSKYVTWEQYFKNIREKCFVEISNDIKELANIAVYICYKLFPNKPKDFCWDCFGGGIKKNVLNNSTMAFIPTLCEYGDIDYLGKKYIQTPLVLRSSVEEYESIDLDNCDICNYIDLDLGLFE